MAETLRFDVLGRGDASDLERLANAVDRFADKLKDLDKQKVDVPVTADTKKAERSVGKFITDLHRNISRAVESLPDIELDADASDAQRELVQIRSQLAELGDVNIGIDMDAAEAERQMRVMQGRLQRLAADSADIQITADATAAITALGIVKAEADKLDGRKVELKIDTDRGLSNTIVQVAALGRALGTLAIPAALVTAAPQVAALGAAALDAAGSVALLPAVGVAAAVAIGALVVGMQGFGDALKNRGDPKAFAESLKELAPAAQQAAITVRDLGKSWREVRLDVQEKLFRGVGQSIKELSGDYLPVLRSTMGGVAESFNAAFVSTSKWLTTDPVVRKMSAALDQVEKASGNAAGAIEPLVAGFVGLVSIGSTRLPALGQSLQDVSKSFRDWVLSAEGTRQIGQWIDQGIASIKQLGRIAFDVGSSLGTIFRVADQEGAGFLDTVERITSAIQEFTSSAQGQQTIANVFRTIRETVDAAWPGVQALGKAIVDVVNSLSDSGTLQAAGAAFSAIAREVAPLVTTLGNLAAAVLPPLLSALSALAPVLVPVAAGLIAMRIAAAGLSVLSTAGGRVTGFVGALKGAEGGAAKFKTAIGGIATFLGAGGPLGLAIGLAITAASLLAGAWADGEAAAADQKARIDALADSLNKYSGAATEATRAQVAQEIGTQKLADGTTSYATALGRAGVDTKDFVAATTGNEQALQKVRTQLDAHVQSLISSSPAYKNSSRELANMGISLEDLAAAAQGNGPAMDRLNDAIVRGGGGSAEATASNQGLVDSLLKAGGASAEMGQRLNEMAADYGTAAQQARDAGAANLVFADVLDTVKQGFSGIAAGLPQTEKMHKGMQDLGDAAEISAKQAGDAAVEWGGVAGGGEAAAKSMAASREAFVSAAEGALGSRDAAERLADSLGLIPEVARTNFVTNASEAQGQINGVKASFDAVPGTKEVKVQTLTQEAQTQLTQLGLKVETLPDGTVKVTAPTDQARAALDAFVAGANAKSATVDINGQSVPAQQALTTILAQIAGGAAAVTINGQSMPAQAALSFALGLINGSGGTVTINGQSMPADQVLAAYIAAVDAGQGTVTLNGNEVPARDVLNAIIAAINSSEGTTTMRADDSDVVAAKERAKQPTFSVHTIRVYTTGDVGGVGHTGQARGGIVKPMANGGLVKKMAGGGLQLNGRQMTPMAGIADVVPPNTWRVVGDRLTGNEAYIPLNGSRRSRSILGYAARSEGYDLVPRGQQAATGMARGAIATSAGAPMPRWSAGSGGDTGALIRQLSTLVRELSTQKAGTTIQNTFAVAELGQAADAVAQVQRTQAAMGLLGG